MHTRMHTKAYTAQVAAHLHTQHTHTHTHTRTHTHTQKPRTWKGYHILNCTEMLKHGSKHRTRHFCVKIAQPQVLGHATPTAAAGGFCASIVASVIALQRSVCENLCVRAHMRERMYL